ncbi:hypothetical protein BC834DRAFT_483615 [Gloeopeniophorella convolvens]|nr:hypothetical protein BC834DRAFT_483615 [Gloeopeniophorella convolvens]
MSPIPWPFSLDKTNKLRHAKAIGAVRDEIVKLLSLRWERLNQRTSQLAILVQKDSADDAQDVDEIRGIYTALIQRREVSMGLVRQEEASANDLERSREKDSVMHLTRAKADCEGRSWRSSDQARILWRNLLLVSATPCALSQPGSTWLWPARVVFSYS